MPKYPLCLWNFPSAHRGTCCCSGLCFTLTTFVRGRGAEGWEPAQTQVSAFAMVDKDEGQAKCLSFDKRIERERALSTEPRAMSSDLASKMPALQGANNHSSPQGAFNELNHSPSPALHHSQATATAGFSRCPLWQKGPGRTQWLAWPPSPAGLVSPLGQECQSSGGNKVRRGQKKRPSESGLGICGYSRILIFIYLFIYLAYSEGKYFLPSYSHDKPEVCGLTGVFSERMEPDKAFFIVVRMEPDPSLATTCTHTHCVTGCDSDEAQMIPVSRDLFVQSAGDPAGRTPFFLKSHWFQESPMDHKSKILTLAPVAAEFLGVMSKLEPNTRGEIHPAAA